jgi:hypothetical protein
MMPFKMDPTRPTSSQKGGKNAPDGDPHDAFKWIIWLKSKGVYS